MQAFSSKLKKADDDCEKEHCEKSFELTDGKKMTWNCVSAVVKWPLKKWKTQLPN